MSRFNKIPQPKKDAILKRIKEDGVNANRAANEQGVSPKTVYGWLAKETTKSGVSWHEHNRVKRENQQLKEIIGSITLDLSRTKKI
jgi:transposase-like protein